MESSNAGGAGGGASTPAAGCYGGGDIAGAVIGSLIGGIVLAYLLYRLYMHYWRNRKDNNLVQEDPENAKQEFAFDNPAFRNEKQKAAANSPLDTKWTFNKKNPDQRQTVDDSHTANPVTRSVSLRGSDFTGLGIEICGGLKEGIYVRKVMPQGPAAQIVRTGDKIISITIDLQHMVQEDAATILSYASPYNVQLELCDGNGTLPRMPPSPAHNASSNGGTSAHNQSHPLYRASSQDDIGTIERNTRRNLFPPQAEQQQEQQRKSQSPDTDEIGNYPTLKLEAPPSNAAVSTTTTTTMTTVHRENEKVQQHVTPSVHTDVQPAELQVSSTSHTQLVVAVADSKPIDVSPTPPEVPVIGAPPIVNKRTKHLKNADIETTKSEEKTTTIVLGNNNANKESVDGAHLHRMGSITSSGIKRDAAGIPQEIPDQMFAAAMAARGNRKSTGAAASAAAAAAAAAAIVDADEDTAAVAAAAALAADEAAERAKNKTKAPRPPARGDSLLEGRSAAAIGSDVTTIDIVGGLSDAIVTDENVSMILSRPTVAETVADKSHTIVDDINDLTTKLENSSRSINIELNANHITVHHSSEAADITAEPPVPNKRQHHHHEFHIAGDAPRANITPHYDVSSAAAEPPSPKPRSSVISLDSSLVEQVLAVADGFTQETRATLSRQLSELNEDHIPAARFDLDAEETASPLSAGTRSKYSDLEIGTQEEILNNYKFKAEPVLISMTSMSQYQYDGDSSGPPSSVAAVPTTKGAADVDRTDGAHHGGVADVTDDDQHDIKMSYGINIPDDVKVSRITADDVAHLTNGNAHATNPTLSPSAVFSSDGHGVNSISITSLDITADELEHIVSQPSSIIAIDDEDLDFTLQSPTSAAATTNGTGAGAISAEQRKTNGGTHDVFIIESLSSMKTTTVATEHDDDIDEKASSNYVTEIQLSNPNSHQRANAIPTASPSPPPPASNRFNGNKPPSPPRAKQQRSPSVDRIPRNTEMKFTTATYESATQRHLSGGTADKRQQAVDQIRSTFERGHTQSEIPVLVRRPSIPASPPATFTGGAHSQSTSSLSSLPRSSPSKIPVFNSASGGGKSGYSSSGSDRASVSGGSSTGHSPPVQARTNGNGFLYRSHSSLNASAQNRAAANAAGMGVNVTVTSIKSASRNPSGK